MRTRLWLIELPRAISGQTCQGYDLAVVGTRKRNVLCGRHYLAALPYTGGHGNLNAKTWRLDDGHLPDFQPRATYAEACDFAASGGVAILV